MFQKSPAVSAYRYSVTSWPVEPPPSTSELCASWPPHPHSRPCRNSSQVRSFCHIVVLLVPAASVTHSHPAGAVFLGEWCLSGCLALGCGVKGPDPQLHPNSNPIRHSRCTLCFTRCLSCQAQSLLRPQCLSTKTCKLHCCLHVKVYTVGGLVYNTF